MSDTKRGPEPRPRRVHVVGLGASAGGIKALQTFFSHVSPQATSAFVVVVHLSPDYESHLAEVLQTTASLPVTQVKGRTPIEAGHVYVVPPNKAMEVAGGHLVLKESTRAEHRRAPIDMFFRTLADSHGSHAVCIVLSGTGPNGSTGLKRVKEYGGVAIAQDPNEAEYPDMPKNAIATGFVDCVLPVAEMPAWIESYLQRLDVDGDDRWTPTAQEEADALRDVLHILRVRTGHDFSNYQPATLQRRIERRISLRSVPDLVSYARLVRQEPDEAVALMRELLISVTHFF
ncbi:MAG: chemotaxis protein CheB, partial [Vicinamibacterales bacterium]